jgi:hypothetical protein
MNKRWLTVLVMLVVIPSLIIAQGRGRGGRGGGRGGAGGGGKDGGAPKEDTTESRPTKPADLSAVSITAKWKDSKTLVITASVKNAGPGIFMGTRQAVIKITSKDGKTTEVAKEETLPGLDVGETSTVTFETTDKKYFDKDLKWTLELTPSDATVANDKKTTTLSPGTPPKA